MNFIIIGDQLRIRLSGAGRNPAFSITSTPAFAERLQIDNLGDALFRANELIAFKTNRETGRLKCIAQLCKHP